MFLWIEWNEYIYNDQIQSECIDVLLKNGFGICVFNRQGNGRVQQAK